MKYAPFWYILNEEDGRWRLSLCLACILWLSEFIVKRFVFFVTNNNSENIYWDFTGEILNCLKKFLHEVLLLPHRKCFQISVRNLVWEIWNWISVPLHTFTNLLCSQWSAELKNEWMYTTTPPYAFKSCKWTTLLCDIWGSHNSDLVGCETVSLCGDYDSRGISVPLKCSDDWPNNTVSRPSSTKQSQHILRDQKT